ncbi:DNA methyltransferase [Sphingomonas sp. SRS2]|uniref:DNA methyltransferase n=1 Tax=Sphingomonas sp. SRS2 TaxID=133190 RepID=UPI000A006748|nr:DNA methyltransferase [Sphingomonas sp. SRS2]
MHHASPHFQFDPSSIGWLHRRNRNGEEVTASDLHRLLIADPTNGADPVMHGYLLDVCTGGLTVKPVAMIADAIRDCSRRSGIVLDAFSGSGTTILAAEQTGRWARAVELDPRYVDVAIRRWQEATGDEAVLDGSGATFSQVQHVFD